MATPFDRIVVRRFGEVGFVLGPGGRASRHAEVAAGRAIVTHGGPSCWPPPLESPGGCISRTRQVTIGTRGAFGGLREITEWDRENLIRVVQVKGSETRCEG
ncbi:hypothetical protein GCM10009609_75350 [Pseudonocardia aurantiaca]|uniref:K Homology domain-containing protein n=1 Tax=Pseudonocardia aurantiaca TaxID=75290 RepID=A0ABW4FCC6_9PSEU